MTKLVCPECRHENEPARIYCHNCGARLDRTALKEEAAKQEQPEEAHRRVRAMFDPHRDRLRRIFFKLSKVILGALATAALIQMVLPPDVPARKKSVAMSVPIGLDLESASQARGAAPLRYSDEQVNAYLAYTLKNKSSALSKWPQFERALVEFDQDLCRFTVERSLFGFSFYTSGKYRVAIQNGAMSVAESEGSVGRMPIHPQLMKFCGFFFSDVARALDHDRKLLAKMNRIEFQPQAVVITPPP